MRASNPRLITYSMEHSLLSSFPLDELNLGPVPVLRSDQTKELPTGWKAWALEKWISGRPWRNSDGFEVWSRVGAFLRSVHAIPVDGGYGPIVVGEAGLMSGVEINPTDGLNRRWATALMWRGHEHRSLRLIERVAPSLRAAMLLHGPELVDALEDDEQVVLHSDLHAQHVLVRDGEISGVIDFGGAFRGVPAWDFAAIGVFNGWPAADAAGSGYQTRERFRLHRRSRLLGLAFATYRHNVEHANGNSAAGQRMLEVIETTLNELGER